MKKDIRWNMKLLYKSPNDPTIEVDMVEAEQAYDSFKKKYDTEVKDYLNDEGSLLSALLDYEELVKFETPNPIFYFYSQKDIDGQNSEFSAKYSLYMERVVKNENKVTFFLNSIGKITNEDQQKFLKSDHLSHFRVLLKRVFEDAKHSLSVSEEQILNMKFEPSHDRWVQATKKALSARSVKWKGKIIPISEALGIAQQLQKATDRAKLASLITKELKSIAPIAEAEINAIYTNKKIDDSLRGYAKPYEDTVRIYRNDPKVIEQLVRTVSGSFDIAHKFYAIKARILKTKKFAYIDRAAKIGKVDKKFSFETSFAKFLSILDGIDPKLSSMMKNYVNKGQIDVYPRIGKQGGAYCHSTFLSPIFILLNHTDNFRSFSTLAHESGHALHSELSKKQGPIYNKYSYSLAETVSTLFETIAFDAILETLSEKEKIIALHDKISDDITTIFRQIACFNFENDLHDKVREKGYVSAEEIALLHNKRMKEYLGPKFHLETDDGYSFVQWSHIRRFFYVYSYAYGMLVSKAMFRRYKADKSFWPSIEKFLTLGGSDSPENILREIGIDVGNSEFWQQGLDEVEENIKKLDKLTK